MLTREYRDESQEFGETRSDVDGPAVRAFSSRDTQRETHLIEGAVRVGSRAMRKRGPDDLVAVRAFNVPEQGG
jgi:hypothetical protein